MPFRRLALLITLAALALLWGVAFVAIKIGLREVSPSTLAVLRFAIADVFLLAIVAAWPAARPRIRRGDLWRFAVLGITGVPAYHLALNWGEERTSASVASLIVATAPVMVAVLSTIVLRERVTWRGVLGITLAFAGVALLAFRDAGTENAIEPWGAVVALLAPVSWAVYTIVAKPMMQRLSPVQITVGGMLIGSAMLLPWVTPGMVRDAANLSAEGWAWTIWLGAGASAGGYLLFNFALSRLSATQVSVAIYSVPVVALVAAWLILGEPLGPVVGVAAALVVAGVTLVERGGVRASGGTPPRADEPVRVGR